MATRNLVVIGASAGGIEALINVVGGLPADFAAAVFVIVHIHPEARSVLPDILQRRGQLPAQHAQDGLPYLEGRIYVAPPDRHLQIRDGIMRVHPGPRENNYRPAIDPLFRSASVVQDAHIIGIVLSGTLDDGTAGLSAIKRRGGLAIVQDPNDAVFDGMPRSALEKVAVDHCVPAAAMGSLLVDLLTGPWPKAAAGVPPLSLEELSLEARLTTLEKYPLHSDERAGTISAFACPDCHGTLWELSDADVVRYRCRVGHAYSVDSLLAGQGRALEDALWIALRSLEEKAALHRRLIERFAQRGNRLTVDRYEEQAREAEEQAENIRKLILRVQNSLDTGLAGTSMA